MFTGNFKGINIYILLNRMRFYVKFYKKNIIFTKFVNIYCLEDNKNQITAT